MKQRIDHRMAIDPELLRLFRVCVWASAYMGLERLVWDRVLRDGIDATVDRVRGECESRGIDWGWCMSRMVEDMGSGVGGRSVDRVARERATGGVGDSGGFGYLGTGGVVDG